MTEKEQREWVAMLGKTPQQQASAIAELLRHANVDDMRMADRAICRAQLSRLRDEMVGWRTRPRNQ